MKEICLLKIFHLYGIGYNKSMKNPLILLRNEIDIVDEEIIELLSMRMKLVKQVGALKKREGLPPLDKNRWTEVLKTKITLAKAHNLDADMVKNIYELIHKAALKIESSFINKNAK